jgi:S1-C subfamily serine protease
MVRPVLHARCSAWIVVLISVVFWAAPSPGQDPGKPRRLGQEAWVVSDATQLSGALWPTLPRDTGPLRANRERTRGPAFSVYPTVAPATVVVRTRFGHGTGFVIDPEAWVVTNHHVIADADLDAKTGARQATIHFGQLKDDMMELIEEGAPALVYKSSPEKDLALLRVSAMPKEVQKAPSLKLAAQAPRPGNDCVAIGHPAAGMLWTVRSGEISGVGRWPGQMIDVVMQRLTAVGKEREELTDALRKAPQRKVVISTCGLNPGDSGGALVNEKGEVIAVSFAIPGSRGGVRLDKFSYHLHRDELTAFLADRPKTPVMQVPDPWPPAAVVHFVDFDKDGTPDTLVFGGLLGPVSGILVDLDQDSKIGRAKKGPPAPVEKLRELWDFEFAIHPFPQPVAFYDTNADGKIDCILVDNDADDNAEVELVRRSDAWTVRPCSGPLLDAKRFGDKKLQARFRQFCRFLKDNSEDFGIPSGSP